MRRSDADEAERERLEAALAALGRARQALEWVGARFGSLERDLPAEFVEGLTDDLRTAHKALSQGQAYLGDEWRAWQRAQGYAERDRRERVTS